MRASARQFEPTWTTSRSGEPCDHFAPRCASASRSSTVSEWLSPVVPPMKTVVDAVAEQVLGLLLDGGQVQLAVRVNGVCVAATRPCSFMVI